MSGAPLDDTSLDAQAYPVLYSFRRCPYAMRGRMGIYGANIRVEYREIVLRDKPEHMVAISPKATVPVLQLTDGTVIDESLDIMQWALAQNDPHNWLSGDDDLMAAMLGEISKFDRTFKRHLDHYKYPNRYPDESAIENRDAALSYLKGWEARLMKTTHLFADSILLADMALFPFVRQFANVDRDWFDRAPLPNVQRWLACHLNSEIFAAIMPKQQLWKQGNPTMLFPFCDE